MGDHGSLGLPWVNKQNIIAVPLLQQRKLQQCHKERLLVGTEGHFFNDVSEG